METQNGLYKDYSPSKKGAIWVSMLVWGSVKDPEDGSLQKDPKTKICSFWDPSRGVAKDMLTDCGL